ncbi:Uncharacterized protein Adt_05071 [Abeliophyllum distichum]|uniref:HAT C-terminal dimerisation domain-containing protein n=1 Tax=Abeliophyllum distichum TaxID=126358 RepID=A0ABD1NQL5_9LAMI
MFGSMAQDAFEEITIIICKLQELQWSKSECMWDITNFKLKNAFDMESQGEFNSEDVRKNYDVPSADEWSKWRCNFQSGAVLDAIRSLYADYVNHGRDGGNLNREKSDLDSYLEEPVLPWDVNFNVLLWWRSEAHKYPTVSKMARDILAIPMSVAVSNAAFYYLENNHLIHILLLQAP